MKTKARFRTALKIWVVIYPSITLFLYLFSGAMAGLPLYQRTLVLTVILVPWIVFLGIPLVDLILGRIASGNKHT